MPFANSKKPEREQEKSKEVIWFFSISMIKWFAFAFIPSITWLQEPFTIYVKVLRA